MSLYRKYRPQSFEELLGQDHVTDVLRIALEKGMSSHAYFFTGPRGTGKTSTARILARALNCMEMNRPVPCNTCEMCLSALEERLTDVIEIDAASHGLVDDARALVEQARFLPTQGKKKIYIIDEVHMLSKSAFNALLKIIEEPPSHVHFILATTESHKVIDTIKSRCQRFDFHLADNSLLVDSMRSICLSEGLSPTDESLLLIAEHARGSFRDSLSLLEQFVGNPSFTVQDVRNVLGLSEDQSAQSFLEALLSQNLEQSLSIIHEVYQQGHDLYQFCHSILESFRILLLKDSQKLSFPLVWIDHFFHALDQLRDPLLPQLSLELAVYKCLNTPQSFPIPMKEEKVDSRVSADPVSRHETGPEVTPNDGVSSHADVFDRDSFLQSLEHFSLKSLLKFSSLEYAPGQLKVCVRTQFELNKLRESETQLSLQTALSRFTGRNDAIVLRMATEPPEKAPGDGLSSSDYKSVF